MNAHTTLPREPETPSCLPRRERETRSCEGRATESGEARVCARDPRPRRARPPRAPAGWGARPVIRPGVAPWPARRGLYKGRELSVLAEERRTRVKATHVDCVCDMREVKTKVRCLRLRLSVGAVRLRAVPNGLIKWHATLTYGFCLDPPGAGSARPVSWKR